MPQFDFFSFFVQIFWLILATSFFYLVYLKLVLKNASEALKMRSKLKNLGTQAHAKQKDSNFIYNTAMSYLK